MLTLLLRSLAGVWKLTLDFLTRFDLHLQHLVYLSPHTTPYAHTRLQPHSRLQPYSPYDLLCFLLSHLALLLGHRRRLGGHADHLGRAALRPEGDEGGLHTRSRLEDGREERGLAAHAQHAAQAAEKLCPVRLPVDGGRWLDQARWPQSVTACTINSSHRSLSGSKPEIVAQSSSVHTVPAETSRSSGRIPLDCIAGRSVRARREMCCHLEERAEESLSCKSLLACTRRTCESRSVGRPPSPVSAGTQHSALDAGKPAGAELARQYGRQASGASNGRGGTFLHLV